MSPAPEEAQRCVPGASATHHPKATTSAMVSLALSSHVREAYMEEIQGLLQEVQDRVRAQSQLVIFHGSVRLGPPSMVEGCLILVPPGENARQFI